MHQCRLKQHEGKGLLCSTLNARNASIIKAYTAINMGSSRQRIIPAIWKSIWTSRARSVSSRNPYPARISVQHCGDICCSIDKSGIYRGHGLIYRYLEPIQVGVHCYNQFGAWQRNNWRTQGEIEPNKQQVTSVHVQVVPALQSTPQKPGLLIVWLFTSTHDVRHFPWLTTSGSAMRPSQ